MSSYQIIDEPKLGIYHRIVVDPVIILFAALLVPIFINLPLYGRFWMPLAWIILNGWLLGSPTKIKETVITVAGCITLVLLYNAFIYLATINLDMARFVVPYYRIVNQGILFFTLYMVVFYQSAPYSIHEYIKHNNQA